jgi:hypothetical protein
MAYALFIDQGLQEIVDYLSTWGTIQLALELYTNNHTPAHGDVNGSYTPCALVGGSAININTLTWTPTTISGEGSVLSAVATYTFAPYAGGTTIYGFMLVNSGGDVIAAGLLDTPYAVPSGGGILAFTLELACFPNTGPFP